MNPPLSRRLYRPRRIAVDMRGGAPHRVAGREVEDVLEEWLVEDRWWAERPLRRRYFELLLETGAIRVVFFDLEAGRWLEQPGG